MDFERSMITVITTGQNTGKREMQIVFKLFNLNFYPLLSE